MTAPTRADEETPVPDTTVLPALTGSPAQIQWAEKIRANELDRDIDHQIGQLTERATGEQRAAVHDVLAPILREVALRHTTAGWWIDNRRHNAFAAPGQKKNAAVLMTPGLGYAAQEAMNGEDKQRYRDELTSRLP